MVKFGVAGFPIAFWESGYKKDRLKVFNWLDDLNLDAFEAQMTYGPRTSDENCELIKQISKDKGISVSAHAAYYIVLTSSDKVKIARSIDTLKRTFDKAHKMGSKTVVLHPGPLYKQEPSQVLEQLSENLDLFWKEMGKTDIGLFLETAGKKGQLGSVEDVLELSKRFKGCHPCIDFGHTHARADGSLGTKLAIDNLFNQLEQHHLFEKQHRIHFHYTPIDFGPKGEIKHKAIVDKYPKGENIHGFKDDLYHPRLEPVIENLVNKNVECTVISETYNSQEIGAMEMKKFYNYLKTKGAKQ
jgi:deoxyribonuclease-4